MEGGMIGECELTAGDNLEGLASGVRGRGG